MDLIWGIDGADWSLLNRFRDEGRIPHLSALMEGGTSGTLRTTIPAYTGIALPTILTGKNPGTTGLVGFERVDGTLRSFNDTEDETFWETAGRQGYKTCTVGVRTTYPPRRVENGVLVSGDLYTPPQVSDYTYPDTLTGKLSSVDDFHDRLSDLDEHQNHGEIENFLEMAITSTRTRHRALQDLMAEISPDLVTFWIGNADKLQHLAWDDKEALAQYYEEVDSMLGETLERFNPDHTYVISDHGFEAVYEKELHLNTWLERNKYLETTSSATLSRFLGPLASKYIPNSITDQILSIGFGLKDKMSFISSESADNIEDQSITSDRKDRSVTVPGINYEESNAIVANEWGINILEQGNKRKVIIRELIDKLRSFAIEGRPVFRFVARREDVYTDRFIERYPDIIVLPTREYHLNHTLSRKIVTPTGGSTHRAGYHIYNPNGVFIAEGEGISTQGDIELSAEDFAPTILHTLGASVPAEIDGSPAAEALPENCLKSDVTTIAPQPPTADNSNSKGTVDKAVEERLEDMGYL